MEQETAGLLQNHSFTHDGYSVRVFFRNHAAVGIVRTSTKIITDSLILDGFRLAVYEYINKHRSGYVYAYMKHISYNNVMVVMKKRRFS